MPRPHEILFRLVSSPGPRGRLGDFRWAGRGGPVFAFLLVVAALYAWRGVGSSLSMLIELWIAYTTAFIALATLAKISGEDAPWRYVLPTAVAGVTLGGIAGAASAFAPHWAALLDASRMLHAWMLGAGFSTFFVGLSLVTAEVRRREQLAADARRQLLEARLQTLTAQIEPHFLMNTLANLRYLIKTDTLAAAEMLDHIADFLQGALERSRSPRSMLGQEVALVASYLAIMRIRLGDRLRFSTDLPDDLHNAPFPPLLLQTLVENAVRHGIDPKDGGGTVRISARRDGDRIAVSVLDDGVGIAPNSTPGVGLRNTRDCLATFYGGRATFALAEASPTGTIATISIPAEAA